MASETLVQDVVVVRLRHQTFPTAQQRGLLLSPNENRLHLRVPSDFLSFLPPPLPNVRSETIKRLNFYVFRIALLLHDGYGSHVRRHST